VAGLGIRLFTDEMIRPTLAEALRARGYDALSCHEVGRANRRISDAQQLRYATQDGRACLSFNSTDFCRLDAEFKAAGERHAGIIVSAEIRDFGTLLRYVQRHIDTYALSEQENILLWLDTSPIL
jgi:hypothetical protein